MTQKLVLYAPNVHTGGGFILLNALLRAWNSQAQLVLFLDLRAREQFVVPPNTNVMWVAANVGSRLKAEFALRAVAKSCCLVFCFHGLPPLLACATNVVIFQQNRLYLEPRLSSSYRWQTLLRLHLERCISRSLRHRISKYIVQTPTMQREVSRWLLPLAAGTTAKVKIISLLNVLPKPKKNISLVHEWDFIYVADGEGHKNHMILVAAWKLLAEEGLRPTLALTLGLRDEKLIKQIETISTSVGLRITNLGQISHEDVIGAYANSRAMIFPSISESFGLPLVEAAHFGLPILAGERDFVRDVCVPADTFDPLSPVSIARSVKRFMGYLEVPLSLQTPANFWSELLEDKGL